MTEHRRNYEVVLDTLPARPGEGGCYISFSDESGFLGGVFLDERGSARAVALAWQLGVNPGGAALAFELPALPAPEWCDRLLSKAEVEAVPLPTREDADEEAMLGGDPRVDPVAWMLWPGAMPDQWERMSDSEREPYRARARKILDVADRAAKAAEGGFDESRVQEL
jgi:hypothetical protein